MSLERFFVDSKGVETAKKVLIPEDIPKMIIFCEGLDLKIEPATPL